VQELLLPTDLEDDFPLSEIENNSNLKSPEDFYRMKNENFSTSNKSFFEF